ncbi:MAG: flavodoxin-dependent (E)-4-hydroxy-3-methylbut-2-enyl-diphosphate synthase [Firmicutes bacterium]|nr:flavodoxin-dependent (E)-4-hydroxy-3-methylbut-2-enyl-diphosphate synthase [Bacillota bacterium]
MALRDQTRPVRIGAVQVGGGAPIAVQSMTNTDTRDVEATCDQIERLAAAGCDIVRVAVPDQAAAKALVKIKQRTSLPLVADIHFSHRLALMALDAGVDKLRINPGNIGGKERVQEVVKAAQSRRVPIRIGVNAGSLEKDLLAKYGRATPEAMVESALRHAAILEELGFFDIVISVKAFDVVTTWQAYRLLASRRNYPLHIGITEAGTPWAGSIRSAVGLGLILGQGLGDTIRVSLTGDPVEEVMVGYEVLKALNLRQRGPILISCPTCGRCQIDLPRLASEVERRLAHINKPVVVAVMGCEVNGPGEAREADVGIAGGKNAALLFRRGQMVRKLPIDEVVDLLVQEVENLDKETAGEGGAFA